MRDARRFEGGICVVEEVGKEAGIGSRPPKAPGYRWVILAMFALMGFVNGLCQFQVSFFAQDIMADFDVSSSSGCSADSGCGRV